MVPGFTVRESLITEMRRHELLARVAAEQRCRRYSLPAPIKEKSAVAVNFPMLLRAPMSTVIRLVMKARAA
ncbi:MAG: hypothetical protein QOF01_517 [Thermomicrobiales bacterium]|jgi:hypothetical protein|nr:hypothetical protein [Thermomicrobiales bacterium]MEA2594048.1 hypothetical protein [Thermomicrobiales bacterium]